jgi:hypothetical protein
MKSVRELGARILAVLREIGDENAYSRYLAKHGLEPSPANWREFFEEQMDRKYRKPKCC